MMATWGVKLILLLLYSWIKFKWWGVCAFDGKYDKQWFMDMSSIETAGGYKYKLKHKRTLKKCKQCNFMAKILINKLILLVICFSQFESMWNRSWCVVPKPTC